MDDPASTKALRSKEKVQFMLEGTLDLNMNAPLATPQPGKKAIDAPMIPCLVGLVTSQDSMNHFAIVFIAKKNKKIECILPLTAELHILDLDSLNFIVYWDPSGWDTLQVQGQ